MFSNNSTTHPNQISLQVFYKHGITKAYHGTHIDNLESILRVGLLSKVMLAHYGIQPHFVTDNLSWELDAKRNLSNYIRLAFAPNHPMFYAKGVSDEIVWLEIDISRLLQAKFAMFFSDRNATDNEVTLQSYAFDWDYTLYNKYYPFLTVEEDKDRYQAEVLVEGCIPAHFLKRAEPFKPKVIPKSYTQIPR